MSHHKLEDKCEGLSGVNDVVKGDDVCVLQLLQERRLSDGSEWSALFLLKAYLLQRNNLVC